MKDKKADFRIVKCERCGMEYQMPKIVSDATKVSMKNCPTCRDLDKMLRGLMEM